MATSTTNQSFSQNYCGTPSSSATEQLVVSTHPPCFDVAQVMGNFKTVYLKVNFHLFVKDNCSASFDVNNYNGVAQEAAYFESNQTNQNGIPERIVSEMNDLVVQNKAQMLPNCTIASTIAFVPLRFVLGDVQIHCDNAFRGQQLFPDYQSKYGQYAPTGINVYYSRHNNPSVSGQGQPLGPGVLIAYPSATLLLHEIGHNLTLKHTFGGNDDCEDTPPSGVNWDKNCDGDFGDDKESNWPCWETIAATAPWCLGTQYPSAPNCKSPCCDPCNLYNNVMGYNLFQNSLTECQINKMLTALSTKYNCDYLAQIGQSTPPPSAILGILSAEYAETDCSFCLQGGASMNDVSHNLEIFNNTQLVYSTDWKTGKAGKFCFGNVNISSNNLFALLPNIVYTAKLHVKNANGVESIKLLSFKVNNSGCTIVSNTGGIEGLKVAPTPSSGLFSITFMLPIEGAVKVMASNLNLMESPKLLYQSENQNTTELSLPINGSNWSNGLYDIQLITTNGTLHTTFIKQ